MSPRRKSPPQPKSRPHIVVLGGANTDFLVRAMRLPRPGETITGTEFDHAEAGGKGANQAVAAARLGARVTFLGRIGADDRGRALLRRLKAEGVNIQHVIRDPRAPTGVALISVDATGEKQIVVAPGANQRLTPTDIRRPAVARTIQQADILILQFEVPLSANLAAARLAHKAGVPIILDPAPASEGRAPARPTAKSPEAKSRQKTAKPTDLRIVLTAPRTFVPPASAHGTISAGTPNRKASNSIPDLLNLVTILRANEYEAEALTGIRLTNRQTAQKAAEHLLERFRSLRAAIIAAGQGNLAVWRVGALSFVQSSISCRPSPIPFHRSLWLPRIPVKAIDATGAGDAFAAALAVALAEGQPIPSATAFANAAAALATTKLGAQEALPKRGAVFALLHGH